MNEKPVSYSTSDGIARIVLNRPQQMNAFNMELLRELGNALDLAGQDNNVKACVLTGAGACFCAGADLSALGQMGEGLFDGFYQAGNQTNDTIRKVIRFQKPLLTAVNGPALGGGTCLALAGDVIIAKEYANFGFVFSRHGLLPDCGAHYLITRLANSLRARELILSGRTFTAPEALEYGLVSKVVPAPEFDEAVQEQASQMARWQTGSTAMAKFILEKAESGCDLDTLLELEIRSQFILFSSKEARERIAGFLKKTPK
jgi:2-(1,2-epoxy-1,2-dihydrophenyl)acetyl-CoA isomerase